MEALKLLGAIFLAMALTVVQSVEVDTCHSCPGQSRQGSGVTMEVAGHGMDPGTLMFFFLPQALQLRELLHRELQAMESVFGNNEDLLRVFREYQRLPSPVQEQCHADNPGAAVVSQLTSVAVYVRAISSQRQARLCRDGIHHYLNTTLQRTLCSWEIVHRSLHFHVHECACMQSLPTSALNMSCSELDAWSYKALLWAHTRVSQIVSTVEDCAVDFPPDLPPPRQWQWARRCLRVLLE